MASLAHLLGASVRGAKGEIMGLAWLHGLTYFQQAAGEVGERVHAIMLTLTIEKALQQRPDQARL